MIMVSSEKLHAFCGKNMMKVIPVMQSGHSTGHLQKISLFKIQIIASAPKI